MANYNIALATCCCSKRNVFDCVWLRRSILRNNLRANIFNLQFTCNFLVIYIASKHYSIYLAVSVGICTR